MCVCEGCRRRPGGGTDQAPDVAVALWLISPFSPFMSAQCQNRVLLHITADWFSKYIGVFCNLIFKLGSSLWFQYISVLCGNHLADRTYAWDRSTEQWILYVLCTVPVQTETWVHVPVHSSIFGRNSLTPVCLWI